MGKGVYNLHDAHDISYQLQQSLHHLESSKALSYKHSIPNIFTNRPLRRPSPSTPRPPLKQTFVFDSLQHLSTPHLQTPLIHKEQQSPLSKWPTIASTPPAPPTTSTTRIKKLTAPEPPPCLWSEGFGFATIAVTSTVMHIALRDVVFVPITGAGLVPTAEERTCLCEWVELARMSERYKEGSREIERIRGH